MTNAFSDYSQPSRDSRVRCKGLLLLALLTSTLLLAACSGQGSDDSSSSSQTVATETITLRLAHGWPKGYPVFGESVDDYAQLVEEMSAGRIQISVDSTNKHKSAFGIFDFVKSL